MSIIDSIIHEPEIWVQRGHYIYNKKSKYSIWTANSVFDINFHPHETAKFNVFEKIALRNAIAEFNRLQSVVNSND